MSRWLLDQQKRQYQHDVESHQDIHTLSRSDRIKHYGLHFAKYCGRIARKDEIHSFHKTLADCTLIALSAANALQDNLAEFNFLPSPIKRDEFQVRLFDAVGRFADGCEKIDHMENFHQLLISGNRNIISALIGVSMTENINLVHLVEDRRKILRARAFYN